MIFQFVPSGHFLSISSRRWSWTQVDLETGADIALPPTDKWRQNERHAFDRPGFHFLIITYFKNCNQASVERWCKCFPGVLQKYPIDQKRGEFSKDGTVRQLCSIVFRQLCSHDFDGFDARLDWDMRPILGGADETQDLICGWTPPSEQLGEQIRPIVL